MTRLKGARDLQDELRIGTQGRTLWTHLRHEGLDTFHTNGVPALPLLPARCPDKEVLVGVPPSSSSRGPISPTHLTVGTQSPMGEGAMGSDWGLRCVERTEGVNVVVSVNRP